MLSFLAFTSKVRKIRIEGFLRENFNLSTLFLFIFFIIFIGFRYNVGGDWINYLNLYFEAKDETISFSFIGDPAYAFINWVSYKMGIGFHGANVLCAIIFMYGLLKFCRYLPRPYIALLVAFPYLINIVGMGYQRQSVAIGLSMLALIKLFKQENLKFFLLVILAATFHKSAILFFPLLIFTTSKNRILITFAAVSCLVAGYFIFVEARFSHFIENYITLQQASTGAMIRVLMLVVPSMLFLIFRNKFMIRDTERRLWTIFAIATFPLLFALIFMNISTTVDRFALYILPIQLFVFSSLTDLFKSNTKPLINILIIIYSAAVLFVWAYFGTHSNHWIPYDNAIIRFISGDHTYFGS